ncbi:MAG: ribbon-helix-helix protein, CopG family [Betaproteobacteria bacterium]|nr:ribbon-helix-helix protein, CopG family [Betaproteobacteria bacterium]
MEGISVKLPPSLGNALAAEARRRNVTQSTIVREALEHRLLDRPDRDGGPSCADLVQDLAGSVKSGRRDLATNKALLRAAVRADARRGRKRPR